MLPLVFSFEATVLFKRKAAMSGGDLDCKHAVYYLGFSSFSCSQYVELRRRIPCNLTRAAGSFAEKTRGGPPLVFSGLRK